MTTTSGILRKAKALKEKGNLKYAELQCREAISSDPDNAEAHNLMGLIAFETKRHAEALAFFETAVRLSPDHAKFPLNLAAAYEALGRPNDAWPVLQSALRVRPEDAETLGKAAAFLVRHEHENALLMCRRALQQGWRDQDTLTTLGHFLALRFRLAEAEEIFREVLTGDPQNAGALLGRGFALLGLRHFQESVDDLKAAQMLMPGNAMCQIGLEAARGGIALSNGPWADAAALLANSIEIQAAVSRKIIPPPEPRPTEDKRRVHRLLYLEIELKAREFEARVLLAIHAAAQGLDVVLGQKIILAKIGYERLPTGLVLIKTMNGTDVAKIRHAAKNGHVIAVLDEEMFGGCGQRAVWLRMNTDPEAVARTDIFVAQGTEYLDLLASVFPEARARALVLGNPRVDLYRPEFRKPAAVAHAPRQILICSQGQVSNPRTLSFPALIAIHLKGVPMQEPIGRDVVEALKHLVAFEISMVPQLQAATAVLAATLPDKPILFRPHPVEDPEIWRRAFAGLENVTVSNDGSLTDALVNSKALIYVRGCATGCEAHFQGVPIIRFDGDGRVPEPGNWISSNIGYPAVGADDILAALARIDAGERTWDADAAIVAKNFHRDEKRLVSAGVAEGLAGAIGPYLLPNPSGRIALRSLTNTPQAASREFDEIKFPATSLAEVKELATRLAGVAGLPAPHIEALAHNVFLFSSADAAD